MYQLRTKKKKCVQATGKDFHFDEICCWGFGDTLDIQGVSWPGRINIQIRLSAPLTELQAMAPRLMFFFFFFFSKRKVRDTES